MTPALYLAGMLTLPETFHMEEFEKDFEKAIKTYPDDSKLFDYLQALKKFNKGLRSHITRNYKGRE